MNKAIESLKKDLHHSEKEFAKYKNNNLFLENYFEGQIVATLNALKTIELFHGRN